MKEIPVSGGLVALVDDADEALVRGYRWWAKRALQTTYARAYVAGKPQYLHRLIMGVSGKSIEVDHENRNGLDCQRQNLRVCTRRQNGKNRAKQRTFCGQPTTSRYKGVYLARDKWRSIIKADGRTVHLGSHETEERAAIAYNEAAMRLHGEFARLNAT